jgi:signal transduction histidine kinase
MARSDFSNTQLLQELADRLNQDFELRYRAQLSGLENEIQQLGARLRESESCKSNFVSNIRNEINNPLASIIGLAASIHGLSVEEKVKRMGKLVYHQACTLEFQMRNIIIAAELEVGEMELCVSSVNMVGLMESATSNLKYKVEEQQVDIRLEIEDHLRFVTDAQMLETICINLLANAIEYSGPNKFIIVGVKKISEGLQIAITDFGYGIDPEVQSKLFQRFKPGERGVNKMHGGHGLGLSIVKELVFLLGGTIELQSIVNNGTTVCVKIPELSSKNVDSHSDAGNELLFTSDEQF